jgi:hypothetical protein
VNTADHGVIFFIFPPSSGDALGQYIDECVIRMIRLLKTVTLLVLRYTNRGFKTAVVGVLVALPSLLEHCGPGSRDSNES